VVKKALKALVRSFVARVFRREMILLPIGAHSNGVQTVFDVSGGRSLLPLRYNYRVSPDGCVSYQVQASGCQLEYRLNAAAYTSEHRPTPGPLVFSCRARAVEKGDTLRVSLTEPSARLNDRPVEVVHAAKPSGRKFIADLELDGAGRCLSRRCSHYLAYEHKPIGRDYYFGDDYVDYPRQKETWMAAGVDRVRQYCPKGRLLEIGCALGLYLEAFLKAGLDPYGVDISEYAVAEAAKRVGPDRVRQCDVDRCDVPFEGPFDGFVLYDVLEHSAHPRRLLEKVSEKARAGSWLFLSTSNAESLTHRVLGPDWEGYTDYSHYGIEQISATTLPAWLRELSWQIVRWESRDIWVEGADPVVHRLREAFSVLPELATLLSERDLGDVLSVVARKS
jgi:2-polyprenyl-3-methyl-5-hydroxy-6-metoxy-1,4-benzoquinol methylase